MFHERQKGADWSFEDVEGNWLGQKVTPLDRAGIYVPGGLASYPSSVLMNAIPARVAGVGRIAMTVPAPGGTLNPLVLAAAAMIGLGLALARPERRVLVITGDGEMLMGLGSLATIAIPMKTDADESRHSPDAKDTHCAFSSLAQPLLGGIPPVLLAIALAAIILLGLAPLGRLPVAPIPYLRPPLRGPPASI